MDLLALTLVPGLGPVLTRRAIETLGSARAALDAPLAAWRTVKGIGDGKARAIVDAARTARERAKVEGEAVAKAGARVIAFSDPAYPPLLESLPDAPVLLYVRGELRATGPTAAEQADRYPVAVVGSRSCSAYGVEQAERFAGALAAAGLTIVSGGARGIDTAAHRSALRNAGRTIVVLGCGLSHCYPDENRAMFEAIVADGRGAIVSELPMGTSPAPENFPARNRIISGLSLGVLVVEAGKASGALITARLAVERHGRDVFVVPGRVDSPSSAGSLHLLKGGGGALVTEPADVIQGLESAARHSFQGTHADRFTAESSGLFLGAREVEAQDAAEAAHATFRAPGQLSAEASAVGGLGLTATQARIIEMLAEPRTLDDLVQVMGVDAGAVRADLTMLELRRAVVRRGAMLERAR